jgi:RNase adaptor protein for sRNA GlmZ degradation
MLEKDVHKYLVAITCTSGCEPSVKIAQDMAADVVS